MLRREGAGSDAVVESESALHLMGPGSFTSPGGTTKAQAFRPSAAPCVGVRKAWGGGEGGQGQDACLVRAPSYL